jgi:hypothetical protein
MRMTALAPKATQKTQRQFLSECIQSRKGCVRTMLESVLDGGNGGINSLSVGNVAAVLCQWNVKVNTTPGQENQIPRQALRHMQYTD